MANIWESIGRAGDVWTYGPMAVREEEERRKDAEAMRKYREAQAAHWKSKANVTQEGLTSAQKVEIFKVLMDPVVRSEMTDPQRRRVDQWLKDNGFPVEPEPIEAQKPQAPPEPPPEAPPEKQPGFFGRLFGRAAPGKPMPEAPQFTPPFGGPALMPPAPTITGPSLPRKPGDLWVQAPMAGAGYGGQAPTSQAPGSKIWGFLGAPGATNAVAARTPTSPYTLQDPGRPATYEEFRENIKKLNVSNPQKAKDYYEKWSNLWQ